MYWNSRLTWEHLVKTYASRIGNVYDVLYQKAIMDLSSLLFKLVNDRKALRGIHWVHH